MFVTYAKKRDEMTPPMTGSHTVHPGWSDAAFWGRVAHKLALQLAQDARDRVAERARGGRAR